MMRILLLALTCAGQQYPTQAELCKAATKADRYYAQQYNEKLMLLGKISELEKANKILNRKLARKK